MNYEYMSDEEVDNLLRAKTAGVRSAPSQPKNYDDMTDEEVDAHLAKKEAEANIKGLKQVDEGPLMQGAKAVGRAGLEVVGGVSNFIDRYTNAPVRAAVHSGMTKGIAAAPEAFASQFGEDPEKAPTGRDIMKNAGVPDTSINTGWQLNPWAKSNDERTFHTSPAGLAGGAFEAGTDATIVGGKFLKGANAVGKMIPGVRRVAEGISAAKREAVPFLGKVIARIEPEDTKAFMKDPYGVKNVAENYPRNRIRGMIEAGVKDSEDAAKEKVAQTKKLRDTLKTKYKDKQTQLGRETASLEQARTVMGQIKGEQAVLNAQSEKLDEIAIASGKMYKVNDLKRLAQKTKQELGKVSVGDANQAAREGMDRIIARLDGIDGEVIPGNALRDVMQQVRADAKFDRGLGGRDTPLDLARKRFTHDIRAVLGQDPEFEAQSAKMKQKIEANKAMARYFGDEATAMGTINSIKSGKVNPLVDEAIKKHVAETGDTTVLDMINKFRDESMLLENMKQRDLSQQLFPGTHDTLRWAEKDTADALERHKNIAGLKGRSAEALIKNQGYKNPSGVAADQLKQVSEPYGDKVLPEAVRNRNLWDQFDKSAANGARLAKAGSGLGAAIGGGAGALIGGGPGAAAGTVIGSALGGGAGIVADTHSGKMLRSAILANASIKLSGDKVARAIQGGVNIGKYTQPLKKVLNTSYASFLLYHKMLMNNDPEYRKLFGE
jgi:hypothetical protein